MDAYIAASQHCSGLLYALILAGVNAPELALVDCLIFGALISATDPGTADATMPPRLLNARRQPLARVA